MGFNLDDYEDVASLNRWFQDNYPMGRLGIIEWKHNEQSNEIHFIVGVWRDINDAHPAVMNYARGKQEEYNRNMSRFYAEDVVTSAYGRAILLLKAAEKTAHKEGVARASEAKYEPNKFEKRVAEKIPVEKPSDPWTIEQKEMPLPVSEAVTALNDGIKPEVIPSCKHGTMKTMNGIGNTNKPYYGYVCIMQSRSEQCPAIWCVRDKSGRWVIPKRDVQTGELQ